MRPIASVAAILMAASTLMAPAHADGRPMGWSTADQRDVVQLMDDYCRPLGTRPALSARVRGQLRDSLQAIRAHDPVAWASMSASVQDRANDIIVRGRDACS